MSIIVIGIFNEGSKPKIFNMDELSDIKKRIENIELKFQLFQIKKLDFNKQDINDDEMNFIFQYNYDNLEYLDLQNKHLTNKGIKSLQNKSLSKIKYLNLSNNEITDVGLKYLSYLTGLNELVLLNMNKLSDDYFLSLEKLEFLKSVKIFRCDKTKLILSFVNDNYKGFILPNLTSIKIVDNSIKIHKALKELIPLSNICSIIKELDLSNTGLTDNGMFRLTKNISVFKNLELINLDNVKLTTYSQKFLKQIQEKNIKIILNEKNLKPRFRKNPIRILLGGSTISGKTSYLTSYIDKQYNEIHMTTNGLDFRLKNYPKLENTTFQIWDTCHWKGRNDSLIQNYIFYSDGIILLFDLSERYDFNDNLSHCLKMITDYFELEELPVLLVGNKVDLKKQVEQEEINKLLAKEKFIGYFEVSAKTLKNVAESGDFMLDYLCEKEKVFPCPIIKDKSKKKKGKK